VLAGFFSYAVTRRRLKAAPMPSFGRKRGAASFTPYIFSEAELNRLLAAAPRLAARVPRSTRTPCAPSCCSGAGLCRGEARRLKVSDVDLPRSLLHMRGTKFFKTRIIPISPELSAVGTAVGHPRSIRRDPSPAGLHFAGGCRNLAGLGATHRGSRGQNRRDDARVHVPYRIFSHGWALRSYLARDLHIPRLRA